MAKRRIFKLDFLKHYYTQKKILKKLNKHNIPHLDYLLKFQKTMVDRIAWPYLSEQDSIFRWRAQLLFIMLFVGLILGSFVLIAAATLIVKEGVWGLAIVDTLGLLIGITLLVAQQIRFEIRAAITSIICYLIGIAVIISVGPLSGGPIWLFAFAVLTGALMGNWAAFIAILINIVSLIIIGLLMSTGKLGNDFPFFITPQAMIAAGASFFFLNTMTSLSVSSLLKGLNESKKRYRLIAENVADVIWTLDMDFRFTYISPSVFQQRGYTVKEAMDQSIDEVVLPESLEKALNILAEKIDLIESGDPEGWEPVIFEIEQYCKDGTIIWTSNNARILIGSDKQPTSILGVTRDITDRVLAEYEIKESEKKYRNLYSNAQIGLARTSIRTGKVLTCNDKMAQIFNYENTDDFINEFVFSENYVDPDLRESLINKMKKTKFLNNVEAEFYGKDKSKVWARFDVRSYYDKGYMEDVVVDITERMIGEDALKESEEHLRVIIEANKDAMIVINSKGSMTLFNAAAEKMFGHRAEDILGQPVNCLMPESLHAQHTKDVRDFFSTGKPDGVIGQTVEVQALRANGEQFPIEISLAAGGDNDRAFVVGMIRDFTGRMKAEDEKKHLEIQLYQAQKMESIGTLAGGIAHDFNNILVPILGYTEMLLTDIPEDSPFRNGMKAIHTSALRAKDLVKQILTFSRQDVNELQLMKIQPIVKEALKLIRSTIPTTIEIKQDINADCDVIKADLTQIHQIVMNLTTNAYHAMEETGGELKVSLKQIKLETLDLMDPKMEPGVYACLIVADTGVGMDKNVTDKIFDPFFTTKAVGKGTGMGLSVVHGIVTNMGGAIQIYSEQGKGTEVHVYFPIEKKSLKKQATHSKTQIQGGTEQILIVDDEEAILTMEKQMLERLGYKVTTSVSSLEALDAFRANPGRFDIVITDMAMPNIAGDKLSAELTKIRSDIPILLCTGFSETISEEKAASLGIKGFLLKPIVMKDLAGKIRKVLDEN